MQPAKPHFYLTTTLPYVNADPHIGFAHELVKADIIVRGKKLLGCEVFFNTGTDEHGLKIYRQALERGIDPQSYVDEYAARFKELIPTLGLYPEINFVRTTDPQHKMAAQEFWRRCSAKGDIYKKAYHVKYCVGCELEKTDSELVDGRCPIHPNLTIEFIDEENYFFRFSKYQNELLALYESRPDFVEPDFRFHEIKNFVAAGLQDFSISRLKSKMPWGIPVPGDDDHVMYVWFDALVNYISVIGWPEDTDRFKTWWPAVQVAGKDNLRQQSAMWQAMLLSAGIEPSQKVIIFGFITSGGQKMSKSLGNVANPFDIVEEYGTDAIRYFLARHIHSFEDSDYTPQWFKELYNANLANGIGNLASRLLKLSQTYLESATEIPPDTIPQAWKDALERYDVVGMCDLVWAAISELDKRIQETEVYKLVKENPEEGKALLRKMMIDLYTIARMLNPILPETSMRLKDLIKANKMPEQPLFPRKD